MRAPACKGWLGRMAYRSWYSNCKRNTIVQMTTVDTRYDESELARVCVQWFL
ncbi:hypothetical protein ADINL_1920 [Nitrincola lacisaponensis]|uniref:Uncharacterized protein n=1 Tax=Nitrincola lacisaponensis TaxID=267850 RepID=A0A063Y550_9GAMM|nr:hypothetical protein ADINL_1920 [Nitrincola lacisaponensis]